MARSPHSIRDTPGSAKAAAPQRHNLRIPFATKLKAMGFIRIGNDKDPIVYGKLEGRRRIEVSLWKDGQHRATNYLRGTRSTVPSLFTTIAGMHDAIAHERTRSDHVDAAPPLFNTIATRRH